MQTLKCVWTVPNVLSPHRIRLVPECCVIELACNMQIYPPPLSDSESWVDCTKGFRRIGRHPIFIMSADST